MGVNGNLKKWHPKKIRAKHMLVAALSAAGMTGKEISDQTGYSESRVSIILSHPEVKDLTLQYSTQTAADIRSRIENASMEAFDTVIHWMRQTQFPQVSQKSALEILDRAGYTKVEKHLTGHISIPAEKASQLVDVVRETSSVGQQFKYDDEGKGRDLGPQAPGSERVLTGS